MARKKEVTILSVLALALVVPVESAPKEKGGIGIGVTGHWQRGGASSRQCQYSQRADKYSGIQHTDELLDKAHAIAVVPNIVKAALGVGGRHGKGVVVRRLSDRRWGTARVHRL